MVDCRYGIVITVGVYELLMPHQQSAVCANVWMQVHQQRKLNPTVVLAACYMCSAAAPCKRVVSCAGPAAQASCSACFWGVLASMCDPVYIVCTCFAGVSASVVDT
jgi:hypothetical protein